MSASTVEIPEEVVEDRALSPTRMLPASDHEARQPLKISFTVGRATKIIFFLVATMIVTGIPANLVTNYVASSHESKLSKLMDRFDLTTEMSIPNWYSSCALLAAAGLLGLIARFKYLQRDRWFRHWLALSLIFVYLSIDEACRFHEGLNTATSWVVKGHGLFYNPWVIPYGIFVGVVGLSYIPLLINVGRRTAILFLAAGAVYVGGALCMDAVGSVIDESIGRDTIQSHLSDYVEESMEDIGELLFIFALLDYIRRNIGSVQVAIK